MANGHSGTNVKISHQQHSVTKLWRHTVADGILHDTLKFRQFTYTDALFTATVLLLLMELTAHRTKCTVQQPFTVPTYSVQWKVQWTLCGVGATDEWLLFIIRQYSWLCADRLLVAAVSNWLCGAECFLRSWCFFNSTRNSPHFANPTVHYRAHNSPSVDHSANQSSLFTCFILFLENQF